MTYYDNGHTVIAMFALLAAGALIGWAWAAAGRRARRVPAARPEQPHGCTVTGPRRRPRLYDQDRGALYDQDA